MKINMFFTMFIIKKTFFELSTDEIIDQKILKF